LWDLFRQPWLNVKDTLKKHALLSDKLTPTYWLREQNLNHSQVTLIFQNNHIMHLEEANVPEGVDIETGMALFLNAGG
jgi:hypothetical protein